MARYKAVIRENTDAQRQYMKQINEQVKKDAQLDGSVNKLRNDISKLTKEYYALSEADRKSAKGMKMAEQVRNMQTEVNKAEQDLLNFRSNVGNYARSGPGTSVAHDVRPAIFSGDFQQPADACR